MLSDNLHIATWYFFIFQPDALIYIKNPSYSWTNETTLQQEK